MSFVVSGFRRTDHSGHQLEAFNAARFDPKTCRRMTLEMVAPGGADKLYASLMRRSLMVRAGMPTATA